VPATNDRFGVSVTTVGNNVLVGAYMDSTAASGAGAAYLFDGSTGALLHTFVDPGRAADDNFGIAVAAVGNNCLVSAYHDDTGATDSGVVYLFDGTTGALLQTFLNPTPAAGDWFGMSVAAVGNNVLVGAMNDDTSGTNVGAAYLFDGSTGKLLQTYLDPTPVTGEMLGATVAGLGNDVLVGAWHGNAGGTDVGAVYLFQGVPEPATMAMLAVGAMVLLRRRGRRA
jgi:hypothetical protein